MIETVGDLMKQAVKECHLSIAILIKDIVFDMEGVELESSIEDIEKKVLEYYGFECNGEESEVNNEQDKF